MRSSENSDIVVCVNNLLRTFKSEVPYARNMGISHEVLDMPSSEAEQMLIEEGTNAIETYEPRVSSNQIALDVYNQNGALTYTVSITESDD